MRVAVIGAGALGTFFAARLAAAGIEVSVVARGDRLAAIHAEGIVLASAGETVRLAIPAANSLAGLPTPDLAVIATKTFAVDQAIAPLAPLANPGLAVLTVQNGVEAPAMVARALPGAAVLAGRVHGFFEQDGAVSRHVGVPPSLAYGPLAAHGEAAAARLAEVLVAAGIGFTRPPDIRVALWEKLVLASSVGGLGALLGQPIAPIRDDPAHSVTLAAAMAEVAAVAEAHGVELPADCVARTLTFVAGFPAGATSSLARDLVARRPSEVDHLTGAIPRLAAAAPVPVAVPVHAAIMAGLAEKGLL